MDFEFTKKYRKVISIIGTSEIDQKTEKITIELGRLLDTEPRRTLSI